MYLKIKEKDFLKLNDLFENIKIDKKTICINENISISKDISDIIKNKIHDNKNKKNEIQKYFLIPVKDNLTKESVISEIKELEKVKFELLKELPKKEEKLSIKEQMEGIIPKELHEYIISSFDIVGDIAIIEVDPRLEEYQIKIAEIILNSNPSILTIVKRSGIHEGTFRIQKHEFLLGKKKKKTLLKENSITLSLDIDKTYYSVRMATERKRIYSQVKDGENILVMFSGIGPYVQSISKNTNANFIYGIEINKDAHKMSLENKELNKGMNTFLIKGDVKTVIPNFNKNRLTVKLNYKDLDKFDLEVNSLEIKFTCEDFYAENEEFLKKILKLKSKGIEIYLKPSFYFNNKIIDFKHKRFENFIIELRKFVKKNNLFLILPLNNTINENLLEYLSANKKINHLIFYTNKYQDKIVPYKTFNSLKDSIKNVYYDIEIAEKNYSSKSMIASELKLFNNNFNVFLGFQRINNLFFFDDANLFSIDYGSEDFKDIFNEITKENNIKFDRIIMPLPKDAENFLNLILNVSKKNTIVHLYDFLSDDELYRAKEKVVNFSLINDRKVEILSVNKCGQYGPKKYRICTDFKFID